MIPTLIASLGAILGPMILRMGLAFIGKNVIEQAIIDILGYLVAKYKTIAAKTEDPLDDERAKRIERLYNAWVDELGRIEAKGG